MSGCRKENLFFTQLDKDEDVFNSKKKELVTSQSTSIKVEDAKQWFEKQTTLNTSPNSAFDSLLILTNASPIWQGAINDYNLFGKEFLVMPLNKGISGGHAETRLLISRDSANNLIGAFMIYVADRDYHNATDGKYRLNDFKGDIIYLDINGRFLFGYKVLNGQIVGTATASLDIRTNSIHPRTCTTQSANYCIYEFVWQAGISSLLDCLVEFQITSTDCPPDPGTGLAGGVGSTGSSGSIGSSSGGGGVGGILPPSVFTAGEMNALRIKYINNGLEDVWLDYLKYNQTLLQATEAFLNARDGFTWQNKAMLMTLIPSTIDLDVFIDYLGLLTSDDNFFDAQRNAGFPAIGTNAWVETLNIFTPTENPSFWDLTSEEKTLCSLYPKIALKILPNKKIAEQKTKNIMGHSGHNDKSDAFRHAYFNALNALYAGRYYANLFGEAHETNTPLNKALEKQMDLFNNSVGQYYGENVSPLNPDTSPLEVKIKRALDNGELRYLKPLDQNNEIIPGITQIVPTNQ